MPDIQNVYIDSKDNQFYILSSHEIRKVVPDYSGSCVRIRRSSDNSEQDFGFTVSGALDTDAIDTFLDGATAYVTRLYDQKGAYNLIQNTPSLQPILYTRVPEIFFSGGAFLESSSFFGSKNHTTAIVTWASPNNYEDNIYSQWAGFDFSNDDFIVPYWTSVQAPSYYYDGGDNVSFFNYEDGGWRNHAFNFNEFSCTIYENGVRGSLPSTTSSPTYERFVLGKNQFGNSEMRFFGLTIYSGEPDLKEFYENLLTDFPLIDSGFDDYFVVMGDSISTSVFCGLGDTWTIQALYTLGEWTNYSKGGYKLTDFDASLVGELFNSRPSKTHKVIIFAGTNDMQQGGDSAAITFNHLKQLASRIWAAGADSVYVITPLPRYQSNTQASIDFELRRQEFSDDIVNDSSGDFTGVVDTRTLPVGVFGAQDDTDYYVGDYVHLNSVGENILATAVINLL